MDCIIVEDQLPAQRILKKYIEDAGNLNLKAIFNNALEAMDFLQNNTVELMFLDIHLPQLSGIDFLKKLETPPKVILTTAFTEYAIESYDLNVVDYLLKPFAFKRFMQAIEKVKSNAAPIQKEIFIKSGYEHIKIDIDDLIYIKSDTDYTEFFLANKSYLSSEPLRYWETELKAYSFNRVHKSYIINSKKIEKIGTQQVVLTHNITIPIGRAYKDDFLKLLN
ncbi:LytR/AlgR family response regulator transcription factor [Wenyingzhuangia fucanilytica]|nr:LytTR family DNA-binding domain-containing protein [Wenyingzhuangia fucanilytica]